MSTHTSHKSLITQIFSTMAISLSISLLTLGAAHAEQYCKSIDKDGNATYTLAPDKGCNAKKMKTVAISHHITPSSPTAPKTEAAKTNSTEATAPTTTGTTATPATTTTAPAAPSVAAPPNADAPKLQQTPNR